jgi:2-polyprenyl-3-methyl-5-hydroxy-6-metoxy-1,4-benzoquinol methylase
MARSGEFFDSFAGDFDTLYDGKRNPAMQWVDRTFRQDMFERFRLSFRQLGDLTGKTVLDVGCGSGPYLQEALARGASRAIGIDPAPGMLQLAGNRLAAAGSRERAEFLEGYFPDVRPPGQADVAIVMGVMDYVEDPVAFLKALRTSVRETAVVSFPSVHWFRSPLRRIRYRLRNCPLYLYSEERLRAVLSQAEVANPEISKIPGAGMDFVVTIRR